MKNQIQLLMETLGSNLIWINKLNRSTKRYIRWSLDTLCVLASFSISYWVFHDHNVPLSIFEILFLIFCLVTIVTGAFTVAGYYKSFLRFISTDFFVVVFSVSAFSGLSLIFFAHLLQLRSPDLLGAIYAILLMNLILTVRFLLRIIFSTLSFEQRKNVVIYGAGSAGSQLISFLQFSREYKVKLLIDDDYSLTGQTMAGTPIVNFKDAKKILLDGTIDAIFLAMPSAPKTRIREILSDLVSLQIEVKTIPSLNELLNQTAKIDEVTRITIEDLLGRDQIKPNVLLIEKTVKRKTVLVTGAGGSIGSELCRQLINYAPDRLLLVDISEFAIYEVHKELIYACKGKNSTIEIIPLIGSVADESFLFSVFKRYEIDFVYHAAAYKHVPLMELNAHECLRNNIIGTLNAVKCSTTNDVKNFTLISTDKSVRPANFMGASKRVSELVCLSNSTNSKTKFSIVRFGNVLGSSGSVVPLFNDQLASGGPITITDINATRYFMTIPEAAQLVMQASSISEGGDIFVLDMGDAVKIVDLAFNLIKLNGKVPKLSPEEPLEHDDVQVVITGLRPGEKLHEELSYDGDLVKTSIPRVMKSIETGHLDLNFTAEFKVLLKKLETTHESDQLREVLRRFAINI